MYAQAIRTPPVYRHRRANNQAHLNMFKGCAFSNEPCDCIKSLKLGETKCPTIPQWVEASLLKVLVCSRLSYHDADPSFQVEGPVIYKTVIYH